MKSKHIITGFGMLFCLAFFSLPDAAGQSNDYDREREEREAIHKGDCRRVRHPSYVSECWERKVWNGDKDLSYAQLSRVDFYGTDLTGAQLDHANLTGARLDAAKLTKAQLDRADLTGANLTTADLTDARLDRADLTGANLNGANLTKADLRFAKLPKARLSEGWDRRSLNPVGANLTGAELDNADLTGADLTGAILTNASLRKAILTGAIVSRSKTKGIDFEDWKRRGEIVRD